MTTQLVELPKTNRRMDRLRLCAATLLTYAVGLWIVTCNPFVYGMIEHPPLTWSNQLPLGANLALGFFTIVFGSTPTGCLTRIAIVAGVVQCLNYAGMAEDDLDLERSRPYVFWRAMYRFLSACLPFLRGRAVDAPPSTSLTEYERVTARYFVVKLLFMPTMISFFYSNLQQLITMATTPWGPARITPDYVSHLYVVCFSVLMAIDIAWFALGCTVETGTYSPIKTVDPYASGWIITLCCYPPVVLLAGQYFVWSPPTFPVVSSGYAALAYMVIGLLLYAFYVIADLSFGLKTGNLTYRGLVDKGPYRLIRHPMYASKNLAWVIFSLPMFNLHYQSTHISVAGAHATLPLLAANWGMLWPMLAWVSIYALRGITEERYLLNYPEYREYCKRVRYRFIPGLI